MLEMKWIEFVIFCLAAYRITHFLVFDKVFEPIRDFFVKRTFETIPYGDGKQVKVFFFTLQGGPLRQAIGMVMNCHWCAGAWVTMIMAALYVWQPILIWLYWAFAAAAVLSLIETFWAKAVGMPEMVERKSS